MFQYLFRRGASGTGLSAAAGAESLERRTLLAANIVVTNFFDQAVPEESGAITFGPVTQDPDAEVARVLRVFNNPDPNDQNPTSLEISELTLPPWLRLDEEFGAFDRSLAPGDETRLDLRFRGTTAGEFTGEIEIVSNDPDQGVFRIPVEGDVVMPAPSAEGVFAIDGDPAAAGVQPLGEVPVRHPADPENPGSVTVDSAFDSNGLTKFVLEDDFLHFDLAFPRSNVTFQARQVFATTPARLRVVLFPDSDGDDQVDQSELNSPPLMDWRLDPNTEPQEEAPPQERTRNDLGPGGYFVRVTMSNAAEDDSVDYTLTLDAENVPLPDVAVTFNDTPVADGDTTPSAAEGTSFGSVQVGETSIRTFRVTNLGGSTLTLGPVQVGQGFEVAEDLSDTLAPGAFDDFSIEMVSAAAGDKSAEVTFVTDAPGKNPFNFNVSGSVTAAPAPEIALLVDGAPLVDGQPTPVSFGPAPQGAVAPTRTFTVRNDGGAPLTLGAPSLPAGFTLAEPLSTSLAPGASDTFTVRLDTGTAGTRSGTVSLATNDADENPFNFPVSGTVTGPVGNDPAPEVTLLVGGAPASSGQSVDFGSAEQGSAGPVRTFTVRNDGAAPLTLGAPVLPAGFTLVEGLAAALAAGESDTFQVALSTAAAGTFAGTLTVPSNDGDEGLFALTLTGAVAPPVVEEAPGLFVSALGGGLNGSLKAGDKKAKGKATVSLSFRGPPAGAGPVTVEVFATTDGQLDGSDSKVSLPAKAVVVKPPKAAKPGKPAKPPKPPKAAKLKLQVPAGLAPGTYRLIVVARGSGVAGGQSTLLGPGTFTVV